MAGILALLPTSPQMEPVTRGCMVELETIRRDGQLPFGDIITKNVSGIALIDIVG